MQAVSAYQGAWRIRTAEQGLGTAYKYDDLTEDITPEESCEEETWLYFLQADDGPIKIGVTSDPESRLRFFQVHNAHEVYYLGVFRSTIRHERLLHSRLLRHRIKGEWFQPHAEVLEALEACREVAELNAGRQAEDTFPPRKAVT